MSNEVKRMRYFDGLFLKQEEFNLEQDYHIRMRRLHNGALFGWGVLKGLEVQAGPGVKEVTVTQGLALSRITVSGEELGREIILTEDTSIDLSGYGANAVVWISIACPEDEEADIVEEKGGTEEIHWWEKAVLGHAASAPADKKENIVLAKVKMKADGTIDSGSILYEEGGSAIRMHAPLTVEGGLNVGGTTDPGRDNLLVEGRCTIKGDLIVEGATTTIDTQNLVVEDAIITVNKGTPQNQSGLEVFRGGPAEAQLIWDETTGKWKAGIKGSLVDLAYGANAGGLTDHSVADGLHRHSKLVSANGSIDPVVSVDNSGKVGIGITVPTQTLDVNGTVRANAFIGSGTDLSNLNASQLTSGTVPDARISSAFAKESDVGARFHTASGHDHNGINSKKIPALDASHFDNLSGANLTGLSGAQITGGLVNQAYIDPAIARKSDVADVSALAKEIEDARGIKVNLGNRLDESLTKGGELRQHIVGTDQLVDQAVSAEKLSEEILAKLRSIRLLRVPLLRQTLFGRPALIGVGANPTHIAFDGTHVWVANRSANTISKIDPRTNGVVATLSAGAGPSDIAFDGAYAWVAHYTANNVSKIDIHTNAVVATVPVGTSPMGVAFDGNFIWVSNHGSNTINKVDIHANAVVATVTVGTSPYGIAFDGHCIWAANLNTSTISKVNADTNAVIATVTVGNQPACLAFDGSFIWATNFGANTVSKIDINTNAVATVPVGANPWGIAFDGTHMWVANRSANTASKIDIHTNSVAATVPLGTTPWGLAFDGTHMWVANFNANNVNKILV